MYVDCFGALRTIVFECGCVVYVINLMTEEGFCFFVFW